MWRENVIQWDNLVPIVYAIWSHVTVLPTGVVNNYRLYWRSRTLSQFIRGNIFRKFTFWKISAALCWSCFIRLFKMVKLSHFILLLNYFTNTATSSERTPLWLGQIGMPGEQTSGLCRVWKTDWNCTSPAVRWQICLFLELLQSTDVRIRLILIQSSLQQLRTFKTPTTRANKNHHRHAGTHTNRQFRVAESFYVGESLSTQCAQNTESWPKKSWTKL